MNIIKDNTYNSSMQIYNDNYLKAYMDNCSEETSISTDEESCSSTDLVSEFSDSSQSSDYLENSDYSSTNSYANSYSHGYNDSLQSSYDHVDTVTSSISLCKLAPIEIPPHLEEKIATATAAFPDLNNSPELSELITRLSILDTATDTKFEALSEAGKTSRFFIFYYQQDKENTPSQIYIMEKFGKGATKQNFRALSLSDKKTKAISIVTLSKVTTLDKMNQEMAMNMIVTDIKGVVVPKKMVNFQDKVAFFSSFCDKGTVEKAIILDFRSKPKELIEDFLQLAQILNKLHTEKHIIHCDIKADNIMHKTNKKTGEVKPKLIDFGVANFIGPDGIVNALGGPIVYFPPEATSYDLLCNVRNALASQLKSQQNNKDAAPEAINELKIQLDNKNKEIALAKSKISYALDVWMLGLLMYKRTCGNDVPYILELESTLLKIKKDPATKDDPAIFTKARLDMLYKLTAQGELFPKPVDDLGVLIWEMVSLDPAQRPTMKEVADRLSKMLI